MIDYKRAGIDLLSIHFTGNKGLGEELKFSKTPKVLPETALKDALLHFFISSFRSEVYFHIDRKSKGIFRIIEEMATNKKYFHEGSKNISQHLFDQSTHPNIKGGELYVCYLKDMVTEGVMCDAIGIFKSENHETYLKVSEENGDYLLETEKGFNINKLDKGALIFLTEENKGYKVSLLDNSSKNTEIAGYWQNDFLQLKPREDSFYHTQNFISLAKSFCEEVLTEENNVSKNQQMMMLNKSIGFFKNRNKFSLNDFKNEVIPQREVQNEFNDYRKQFYDANELQMIDDFQVSPSAFNKNKKYLRSIIKLDKNFHVYVHSKHEYIEKGFDEERGMKFYKLYFDNET